MCKQHNAYIHTVASYIHVKFVVNCFCVVVYFVFTFLKNWSTKVTVVSTKQFNIEQFL